MQAFKNILIPTDFSPVAWTAVQLGIQMAKDLKVRLTVLHVLPSSAKFSAITRELSATEQLAQNNVKSQMEHFFGDLIANKKSQFELEVIEGTVDKVICKVIRQKQCDLVIMGVNSHGQDDTPGSNTGSIINHCQVPVLVVPNSLLEHASLKT